MSRSLNRLQDAQAGKNAHSITHGALPMVIDSTNGNLISVILASYFFVISILSIPSRLLMRKNMGERVFTVFAFSLSFLVFVLLGVIAFWFGFLEIFVPLMDFRNLQLEGNISEGLLKLFFTLINPYSIFFILFLQRGAIHFKQALSRGKKNEYKYSFSLGDSMYFNHKKGKKFLGFEINEELLVMLYEPWGILRLSVPMIIACAFVLNKTEFIMEHNLLSFFLNRTIAGIMTVAIVFSVSAISLFLEEFGSFLKERGAVLDMLDGGIDMQKIIAKKEKLKVEQPQAYEEKQTANNLLN